MDKLQFVYTSDVVNVVRCRDCAYFEVKSHWAEWGGIPILAADAVPTCNRWSDGCKTDPDGYCFLGQRRESDGQ